jgi:hypothetical protein
VEASGSAKPQTVETGPHIALAVVPGQGHDLHGIGSGLTSEAAQTSAMAACPSKRCRVVITYGPGQCAHIVLGTRQIFWNNALFSAREKDSVLEDCSKVDTKCEVVRSECLPE